MSESGGAGRREVAYRLFAAEYDDATLEYSEEDEERAPNYVVTPTGARANRLFVVGVLTEVEQVSDDVLRGRIVDPTGAFVVYAGQYQPDPKTFLERADPPAFVSVTGKARTFTPEGSDRVLTSVRPESINEVDSETRDRWIVGTAAHAVDRVATFADAIDRPERGDELRDALVAEGVDEGIAEGIPLAIDHYGTTEAYLAAVRELAIQAAAVVAGERDEVEALDLAPDDGGPADADLTAPAPGADAAPSASGSTDASDTVAADVSTDSETASATSESVTDTSEADPGTDTADVPAEDTVEADAESLQTAEGSGADEEPLGDFDAGSVDASGDDEATEGGGDVDAMDESSGDTGESVAEASTDEMYELDEEERERVTEEYGTEFTTGSEVDEPGEADIETPGPDEAAAEESVDDEPAGDSADEPADADEELPAEASDEEVPAEEAESVDEADDEDPDEDPAEEEPADESPDAEDVDLEAAVVDAMEDLDDGDGAEREAVVAAVVDEYGADPGAVEDAIQDALMSGLCYEPGEDRLKAI